MKKNTCVLLTLTISTLSSCAGPENYTSKMSRYTPKQYGINQVPEITSSGFEFSSKNSRFPASNEEKATSIENTPNDEATLSNKKLYFLTLFGQYESMKKYGSSFDAPAVNICPQFHTSLIEHNGRKSAGLSGKIAPKSTKKFFYDTTKFSDPAYVALHPELSLPLSKNEVTPKVIDIFRSQDKTLTESQMNEITHDAIDIHLAKTYTEINELCEHGVSDNYYIYENLITHIKNSSFRPVEKNMNTLLKTTIFSNTALIVALEKIPSTPMRSIASVVEQKKDNANQYSKEVITRLNVEWVKEYFDYLRTSK